MNKPLFIVSFTVLAVAIYIANRQAEATQKSDTGPQDYYAGQDDILTTIGDWTAANITESEAVNALRNTMPNPSGNIAAMLAAISAAEGTSGQADPYRVCFGYSHTINSFAEHPAITGEWRGKTLSDSMCKGAGLGPGCVSTAAGKYQIIKRTWASVRDKLGLTDFSPASQDAAAAELLRQRGALGPLARGDFAGAVSAARKEWASLPGAGYGQGERTIAWLETRFVEAGGVLA